MTRGHHERRQAPQRSRWCNFLMMSGCLEVLHAGMPGHEVRDGSGLRSEVLRVVDDLVERIGVIQVGSERHARAEEDLCERILR